jgi:hypothetical protein
MKQFLLFNGVNQRLNGVNQRLNGVNQWCDQIREVIKAEMFQMNQRLNEAPIPNKVSSFQWCEDEETADRRQAAEFDDFSNLISVLFIRGIETLKWTGTSDYPISQIQEDEWFAQEESTAWSSEGESYPVNTPVGVVLGDVYEGKIWLGTKPAELLGTTRSWESAWKEEIPIGAEESSPSLHSNGDQIDDDPETDTIGTQVDATEEGRLHYSEEDRNPLKIV